MKQLADELACLGHGVRRVAVDRRGASKASYAALAPRALAAAGRFRPDVVYSHFLFPAGAAAALASLAARAPLVATAHGQDVRNVGTVPGVRPATRLVLRRAAAAVAVSDYLRRELVARLPEFDGRVEVIDCGVDLELFRGREAAPARERLGWRGEPPFYLCVGSLSERKNVVRLADAFARVGKGSLAFVGDGPLRARLEGREGVTVAGPVPRAEVVEWLAACDLLCQPSLVEPFGQALLEAMASERPVLATRVGGPPEFVAPGAGVLVDPESVEAIAAGLHEAARLPVPNAAARREAERHDVRRQGERIGSLLERAAGGRA